MKLCSTLCLFIGLSGAPSEFLPGGAGLSSQPAAEKLEKGGQGR